MMDITLVFMTINTSIFYIQFRALSPDSTPIRVELDKEKIPGEILICENFELTIAVDKYLGQEVSIAYLYCEPWNCL